MKPFEIIFAKRAKRGVENHYENGFLRMGFRGIENPYKTCGKLMILVYIWGYFGRAEMEGIGFNRSPVATLRDGGGSRDGQICFVFHFQKFSKKKIKKISNGQSPIQKKEKIRDGGWSGWGPQTPPSWSVILMDHPAQGK